MSHSPSLEGRREGGGEKERGREGKKERKKDQIPFSFSFPVQMDSTEQPLESFS